VCNIDGSACQVVIANQFVGSGAVVGERYPVDFNIRYSQNDLLA
jgi:hypothetical protein